MLAELDVVKTMLPAKPDVPLKVMESVEVPTANKVPSMIKSTSELEKINSHPGSMVKVKP